MGCFSGSTKGQSTSQVDKLTSAQKDLVELLGGKAAPAIEAVQGATIPGMQFAPGGPSPVQQQGFDFAGQLPNMFSGGIQDIMKPVGDFAQNMFQQQTIPAIMGGLGSQGTARSSGAADILGREGRNLSMGLASQFAPYQMNLMQQQAQLPGQLAQVGGAQRGIGEQQNQFGLQRFMAGAPEADPRLGFVGPAFTSPYDTAVQQGFYAPGLGSQALAAAGPILTGMAASDERLKENIIPIDNALEKVKELDGKTYNYKTNDPKNRDGGIIAQDLEKVLPEAIVEKDGVKYVKYEAVVALLVNAVNELMRKVG